MDLLDIADQLTRDLGKLRFRSPVACVYNPFDYARASYAAYVRRYGQGRRDVILLGMNPGPWGMVQSGVPFGEVSMVREWLKIREEIGKPPKEHPKRPVTGLACHRNEVSGARLWGWIRDTFGTPQKFFRRFFVANYCPLAFLEDSGRNRTPDKLPRNEKEPLFEACDEALLRLVECMQPRWIVGIGKFAENRLHSVLSNAEVTVGGLLHPSPASPAANKDWASKATRQIEALGIKL